MKAVRGLTLLTLLAGVMSGAMGGLLILFRGTVEGAVWLGVPITVAGLALIGLALVSARREPGPDDIGFSSEVPRRPGLWFPVGIVLILLLQVVYLIWWANFSRR